jgi:hypothetical protein
MLAMAKDMLEDLDNLTQAARGGTLLLSRNVCGDLVYGTARHEDVVVGVKRLAPWGRIVLAVVWYRKHPALLIHGRGWLQQMIVCSIAITDMIYYPDDHPIRG